MNDVDGFTTFRLEVWFFQCVYDARLHIWKWNIANDILDSMDILF